MPQLTANQLAVIKSFIEEEGWTAHKIWTEHPALNFSRRTINNQVKKMKKTGSKDRRKESGRPIMENVHSIKTVLG